MSDYLKQIVNGAKNIVLGKGNITIYEQEKEQKYKDSEKLLVDKIKKFWIDGVFLKSLYAEFLIQLNYLPDNSLINNPWSDIIDVPNVFEDINGNITSNEDMFNAYCISQSSLLIVGQPGSGKTTALLDIADKLIDSYDETDLNPIPVVLNLANWQYNINIRNWVVKELLNKYQVPSNISEVWIENNRLVYLFDGLDEVVDEKRLLCVNAINFFIETNSYSGIVVTCRYKEYRSIEINLRLKGSIVIKPLTEKQILLFFEKLDYNKFRYLIKKIKSDDEFKKFISTPLIFNLALLTYDIKEGHNFDKGDDLFERFFVKMLIRKGNSLNEENREKVIKFLHIVATNMEAANSKMFMIEEIQPLWMKSKVEKMVYLLTERLVVFFLGAFLMLAWVEVRFLSIIFNAIVLSFLLTILEILVIEKKILPFDEEYDYKGFNVKISLSAILIVAIFILLFLCDAISFFEVSYKCCVYLVFLSIASIFSRGKVYSWGQDVISTEKISVSIKNIFSTTGLFIVVTLYPFFLFLSFRNSFNLGLSLLVGILIMYFLASFKIESNIIENVYPNFRIKNSIKSFAYLILPIYAVCVLVEILYVYKYALGEAPIVPVDNLSMSSLISPYAMYFTYLALIFLGSENVLKHYIIRCYIKVRYGIGFLDIYNLLELSRKILFLRQVGGGFIFIHGKLQDFFCSEKFVEKHLKNG